MICDGSRHVWVFGFSSLKVGCIFCMLKTGDIVFFRERTSFLVSQGQSFFEKVMEAMKATFLKIETRWSSSVTNSKGGYSTTQKYLLLL